MTPDELRARRHDLGMSQSQLAAALGITPGRLEHWEAGRRAIPPFLHLALDALGARRSPPVAGTASSPVPGCSDELLTISQAAWEAHRTSAGILYAIDAGLLRSTSIVTRSGVTKTRVVRADLTEYLRQRIVRAGGGTSPRPPRPHRPPVKLTEAEARAILAARGTETMLAVAARYHVSRTTVLHIWHGHTWAHLQSTIEE